MEGLEDNGLLAYLSKKYVDNVNFAIEDPEPEACLVWLSMLRVQDQQQGGSRPG